MAKIKQIPRPSFLSAKRLSPLQLNAFRCNRKHTLLTPEQLRHLTEAGNAARTTGNDS